MLTIFTNTLIKQSQTLIQQKTMNNDKNLQPKYSQNKLPLWKKIAKLWKIIIKSLKQDKKQNMLSYILQP